MAIASSRLLRFEDHFKISLILSSIRSIFVKTLTSGKFNLSLIDEARSAIETKLVGVVTSEPSCRNIAAFCSTLKFCTKKGPLVLYAKSSICPGVSTIK